MHAVSPMCKQSSRTSAHLQMLKLDLEMLLYKNVDINQQWWPSGLNHCSNSSRVAAEDPGSNPARDYNTDHLKLCKYLQLTFTSYGTITRLLNIIFSVLTIKINLSIISGFLQNNFLFFQKFCQIYFYRKEFPEN